MAIKLTKAKVSVPKLKYKITISTMVGDGDRYPDYSKFKPELTQEDELILKWYTNQKAISDDEDEQVCELLYEIEKDYDHFWHDLLYHWDPRGDCYEEIQKVKVEYYNEDGVKYLVSIE